MVSLIQSVGYKAKGFRSAEDFLKSRQLLNTACLILDVAMPGMSGPDLQSELIRRGHGVPIVFITAHADQSDIPRLIEQGAVAWLRKPFSDTALREALDAALASP